MIRNIINGIVVGSVNIIPGISGGTALVFLGIFDKTMKSISNIIHFKSLRDIKEDLWFLFQISIGLGIGIIGFAKIIEYLFTYYHTQTLYWFIGLIAFSTPSIIKSEMKNTKFSIPFFIVGMLIIGVISWLSIGADNTSINPNNLPTVNINLLMEMVIFGAIGSFAMIIPGVSGSMVLLLLGKYELVQSYLANITLLQSNIIIPVFFFGIGAIIGVAIAAKTVTYCIAKFRSQSISLILGLIIMSVIVLIPINVTYDLKIIISSLIAFLFGGLIIVGSQIYENKKVQQ